MNSLSWEWIPILIIVGVALLFFEVLVPGMVLATLGTLCLIGSVAVAFALFGPWWGGVLFVLEAVALVIGGRKWLRWFPKTQMGRRIVLQETVGTPATVENEASLLNQTGVTISICRPSGVAEFGGRRYDVISEAAFLQPGQRVKVVTVEGPKVVVRAL